MIQVGLWGKMASLDRGVGAFVCWGAVFMKVLFRLFSKRMSGWAPGSMFMVIVGACVWIFFGAEESPGREDLLGDEAVGLAIPLASAEPYRMRAGVVLGLYGKEEGFSYQRHMREIRELGATWVEILVPEYQEGRHSTCIGPDPLLTATEEEIARAVCQAHRQGLKVLLLPIVLLSNPGEEDWRGNIEPEPLEEWSESYRVMLLSYARLAQRERIEALSVGSELCSMEKHEGFWRGLIAEVRALYGGEVTYAANWDHYNVARFFDALDFIGISGYFSLTGKSDPDLRELVEAWKPIRERLWEWRREHGKPIVFTEIGYPSIDGANEDPWNYVMEGPLDLAEQALCYQAIRYSFAQDDLLSGIFFYDWWGDGGPEDRTYTPRRKPAEEVLKRFLHELAGGRLDSGVAVSPRLGPEEQPAGGRSPRLMTNCRHEP